MKVAQLCLTLCHLMDYTVHGILQAKILAWVAISFSRGPSQPRSPKSQRESLPTEPQGKPKNTRVGSLSLLQRIFLTQESNWGLLHCRQILYQRSYCVDHNKLWKMLKEIRRPNHLTCLLRKLYVGQEAIVRPRHRTTDWFQIGKGVC